MFRSLYSSACFSTGLSLSHRLTTGLSRLRLTLWFSRLWRRSSIFVRILVSSSPGKSPVSFHCSEWFIWVLLWIPLSSGLLPPSREREAMLNRRSVSVLLHSACLCGGRHLSGPSQPSSRRLVRSFGCGVGCSPPGRNPLLAFGLRREHLSSMQGSLLQWSTVYGTSIFSQLHCSGLFRQLDLLGQSLQTGEHCSPILNSIDQRILRGVGTIELVLTCQSIQGKNNVLADSLSLLSAIRQRSVRMCFFRTGTGIGCMPFHLGR